MSDCQECDAALKRSEKGYVSKWTQVRAVSEGWFFTKTGQAFCPAHVPTWVAGWRARQNTEVQP